MPNKKSVMKRMRTSEKSRLYNALEDPVQNAVKKVLEAVETTTHRLQMNVWQLHRASSTRPL